jgi:2-C-methyl-D-erythritol 4-phosphate cytidylyltransferase
MSASTHVLIPAAGRGQRFGGPIPKQLEEVAGKPILAWALERLREAGLWRFVVALPPEQLDWGRAHLGEAGGLCIVAGGDSRQASVLRCLERCEATSEELVLVHDGARAAVDPRDVAAVLAAAEKGDGAVLGRPVSDTLKRLEGTRIVSTEDRNRLFRAETPQVFRRRILEQAYSHAARDGFQGSDEASLVERLEGTRLVAVTARHPNPKITWRGDLPILETLLSSRRPDRAALEVE